MKSEIFTLKIKKAYGAKVMYYEYENTKTAL
jgi:hypothetical protein